MKGYVRFAVVVTGAHALHRLHHAGVGPATPAAAFFALVTHRDLQIGQHSAGQERSHAGQTEPKKEDNPFIYNNVFLFMSRIYSELHRYPMGLRA